MNQINNIQVGIGLATLPISQKGFGMPLIAGTKVRTGKPDYVEVTDADQLLAPSVGFSNTDAEYKMAMAMFSQSPRIEKLAVFFTDSWANMSADLADLRNSGKDSWYYFLITSRDKANIAFADTYINSLEKFGVFATSDQTAASTGDRTFILISNHADEYPDAGVVGRCAAEPVGSITWDSKQISGQKNSDVTMAEQSTLLAANFNLIRDMGGVNVLWEGKTMSGQYADVIISRDYLKARLVEALQALKINSKKIPMDTRGIRMIESSIRNTFTNAGKAGVLAPVISEADRLKSDLGDYQYKLSMPESVSEIAQNDRTNRIIAPITFTAVVGGGINKMTISGTLEA